MQDVSLPIFPSPRQTPRISFWQKWDAPQGFHLIELITYCLK